MKKTIWLIALIAVVILLALTCPKEEQHKEVVGAKISAMVNKEMAKKAGEGDFEQGLALIGSIFTDKLVDIVLDSQFKYKNYVVFSLGQIKDDDEMKTISVGLLNQVITFEQDDLEDAVEDTVGD